MFVHCCNKRIVTRTSQSKSDQFIDCGHSAGPVREVICSLTSPFGVNNALEQWIVRSIAVHVPSEVEVFLMGCKIVTVLVSLLFLKFWLACARELAVTADSWYIIGTLPMITGVQVTLGQVVEENVRLFLKTPMHQLAQFSPWH